MQNNATVLPAQSDANVACTRTRIGRNERRPGGQVKTHLSLRAQRRLFRVRCNTGGGKKADLVRHQRRLHGVNIFREGARSVRLYMKREREFASIKGKCRFRTHYLLAFIRSSFNSCDRESFIGSCGSPRVPHEGGINDRTQNTFPPQRGLFLCLISTVADA